MAQKQLGLSKNSKILFTTNPNEAELPFGMCETKPTSSFDEEPVIPTLRTNWKNFIAQKQLTLLSFVDDNVLDNEIRVDKNLAGHVEMFLSLFDTTQ